MDHKATIHRTAQTLRRVYEDRRWLIAEPIVQAALYRAELVQRFGAREVFALGAVSGSGNTDSEVPHLCLGGAEVPGLMANLRAGEEALDTVSEAARQRIDQWDPASQARAIRAFYSAGRPVAGRTTWGRRPDAWQALEDKTTIDTLWDDVGVPRAPSTTVDADERALVEAHRAFDEGAGTVWAADNREGWHGGASGIYWVHDAPTRARASAWMHAHADKVRVMPFLEGVPCSIHGIVFPDDIIALRPCEMLVLREPAKGRFHYARAATTWDPAPKDRQVMRDTAKLVGAYLRRRYDYQGAFTIDGVLSAKGFLPTELNPRFGAALGLIGRTVPDVDLCLLHLALIEQVDQDWRPRALEEALLHFADRNRQAQASMMTSVDLSEKFSVELVRDRDDGWRPTTSGETPLVSVSAGPSPGGAMARLSFDVDELSCGPPLGPQVASVLASVDKLWELGLPMFTAAQPSDR